VTPPTEFVTVLPIRCFRDENIICFNFKSYIGMGDVHTQAGVNMVALARAHEVTLQLHNCAFRIRSTFLFKLYGNGGSLDTISLCNNI